MSYFGYDERDSINSEKNNEVNSLGIDYDFITLQNAEYDNKYNGDEAKREEEKNAWWDKLIDEENKMDKRTIKTKIDDSTPEYKEYYSSCAINPDCYAKCNYEDTDELKNACGKQFNQNQNNTGGSKKIRKNTLKRKIFKKNKRFKKSVKRTKNKKNQKKVL